MNEAVASFIFVYAVGDYPYFWVSDGSSYLALVSVGFGMIGSAMWDHPQVCGAKKNPFRREYLHISSFSLVRQVSFPAVFSGYVS